MNSFVEDFKHAWNKPNNGLTRLIIINVSVFVILKLLWLLTRFGVAPSFYTEVEKFMMISPVLNEFIVKPWTLITYFFTHFDFLHILFNMLIMYWFGVIFEEFLGSRKLVALYILGGLSGGFLYLILYNTIPYLMQNPGIGMVGASAGVYAIVLGAATVAPEYRMHLLFFGAVRIKYIAAVYVFLSVIGLGASNVGGNIAHLGGIAIGYFFVRRLAKGDDWSIGVWKVLDAMNNLFKPKPKMKVSHRNGNGSAKTAKVKMKKNAGRSMRSDTPDQSVIDAILDKISESGYDKLSAEEKQILFKASQKNMD